MFEKEKEAFKKVIEYSQKIDNPNVDDLFRKWELQKQEIITNLLEGKLIWESQDDIEVSWSEEYKNKQFQKFVELVPYPLDTFLENINYEEFFNNKLEVGRFGLPEGSKVIKAFKQFLKDEDEVRYWQDKASILIQKQKIVGKLCLSVHPLDFLSLSENDSNWRSCHALDGDFRGGNLSYMVDDCTLIAYLKSDKVGKINHFPESVPWNDKRWRVLLFTKTDAPIMFAGRQYPFESSRLMREIDKVLGYEWDKWENNYFGYDEMNVRHIRTEEMIIPFPAIVRNGKGSLAWNDVLTSSVYKQPQYKIRKNHATHSFFSALPLTIGGEVKCLSCGKEKLTSGDSMICPSCHDERRSHYCNICGEYSKKIIKADSLYNQVYTLCEDCFRKYGATCKVCGKNVLIDNLTNSGVCFECISRGVFNNAAWGFSERTDIEQN